MESQESEKGRRMTSFVLDIELLNRFKKIAGREETSMTDLLTNFMKEYIKQHGDGNPSFELTQWIDNEDFKVVPALWSKVENWNKYLSGCTKQELENLEARFAILKEKAIIQWKVKNA